MSRQTWQALMPMMIMQAVVSMDTFLIGVLGPQLGLSLMQLAGLNMTMWTLGAISSLATGWLVARLGDTRVAALRLLGVALAMGPFAWGVSPASGAVAVAGEAAAGAPVAAIPFGVWLAVMLLGVAAGPETPVSAAVLTRVTPPAQRPWVFSIRQTGNQIGTLAASLTMPLLLLQALWAPFALVVTLAVAVALWCLSVPQAVARPDMPRGALRAMWQSFRQVWQTRSLRMLAITMAAFSSLQISTNALLLSHAVHGWNWSVTRAAVLVAVMQAGGWAGRLFWGWVGRSQVNRPRGCVPLLASLGVAMVAACVALIWGPDHWPTVWPAAFALGLCVSGWNGVMVSEATRQGIASGASAGATGAVMMVGYLGLATGSLIVAGLGLLVGSDWAFTLLSAAVLFTTAQLWRVSQATAA